MRLGKTSKINLSPYHTIQGTCSKNSSRSITPQDQRGRTTDQGAKSYAKELHGMGDDSQRAACWRGLSFFINYSEGDNCWVAVTSTFPSSSSMRGAQSLHPNYPPWMSAGVSGYCMPQPCLWVTHGVAPPPWLFVSVS